MVEPPEKPKKLYISLNRDIVNHCIFKDDAEFFRAWVALLVKVNHSVGKKIEGDQITIIDIGETLTSEKELTKICMLTRKRLKRFLKILESDNMISLEQSRKGTRLKVHGYRFYQNKGTEEEQNRDRTGIKEESKRNQTGTKEESKRDTNNKKDKNSNDFIMNNNELITTNKQEGLCKIDLDIDLILKTYIVGTGHIYRGKHLKTKIDIKKLLTHKDYMLSAEEVLSAVECYLIVKNSKKNPWFHKPSNFFISNRTIGEVGNHLGIDKNEVISQGIQQSKSATDVALDFLDSETISNQSFDLEI